MSINAMLRELGYTTSPTGIAEFQRDSNRLGSSVVLVSGELDAPTRKAVRFAHNARAAFQALRERRQRDA